jgi:hypothetical protein
MMIITTRAAAKKKIEQRKTDKCRNEDSTVAFVSCEAQSWVLVNHVFCRLSPNPA